MKYLQQAKTRNQLFFIVICILTISPFFLAKYLYDHQELINKTRTVNKGHLISQEKIFNIDSLKLKNISYNSSSISKWIDKKWHILYIPSNNHIDRELINTLQNVNIALGKEESRAQRTIIFVDYPKLKNSIIPESQRFLSIKNISKNNKEKLYKKFNIPNKQDTIWIADPLGNVMLYYTPPFDTKKFKDVLVDLRKLLSISVIG